MTETVVRVVAAASPDDPAIREAATLLRRGELVAFPTETVYGLGADALDPDAIARIYAAKGRPAHNPLIVHVESIEAARALAEEWPDAATILAERFWPDPLTLVVRKIARIPESVTAGLGSVAIRVPAHPVAQALLRAAALPIAAPSANRSEAISPTTAAHVLASLGGRIPLILDGGPATVGIESTVIDLSGDRPLLLRPGMIAAQEIIALIGPIEQAGSAAPLLAATSPGMQPRHYAPRAPLVLYQSGGDESVAGLIALAAGVKRVGAIVIDAPPVGADQVIVLPNDPAAYARSLYAALHTLDNGGAGLILVQRPPSTAAWNAITDRLSRAAHR